jgi:phospholipid/cholesterol/gamma-HCH transport system substrate-binding protein
MKLEAKVGIFVISGIVFLFLMSTQVNKFNMSDEDGYELYGYMSNISGLEKFSKIKINGLEVGHIKNFKLDNKKVRVTLIINNDIKIPKNSILTKAQDNFLGGKFIDILLGDSSFNLKQQESITNEKQFASFEQTSQNVSEAANEFKLAMSEIRTLISSNRENIDTIIYEFKHMTISIKESAQKLNKILSENENKIKETIGNANLFFSNGSELMENNNQPLKDALTSVDTFFDEGKETVRKVDKYLTSMLSSELELHMKDEYLFTDKSHKVGLGLEYRTNPTRFYSLSLVSADDRRLDSDGNVKTPKEHENGRYLLSAQFGKRYAKTTLRAGIIESSGGVGIDQLVYNDKVRLSADIFDFNGVNDARGSNPHARTSIRYSILKHIDFYLGYDNFLNKETDNIYFGVGFRAIDNDLKNLLGTGASFAK